MKRFTIAFIAACAMFTWTTEAYCTTKRSQSVRRAFVKLQACPATGLHKLPCKGWIIDHRVALCVGGRDAVDNLQWQTVADAKAKDKWECKP